jgi:hypothetical protein
MRLEARSKVLAALGLALAGLACGSEERTPPAVPPPAAEPKAAAPAPPLAPVVPEPVAEAPEWEGRLPSDFPSDVPQYPGSKVTSARGTADMGVVVQFDSPDPIGRVAKFYADSLASQGWQTQTHDTPEGTMIIADKDDRLAQAIVHSGGQGTLVDMIIARVEAGAE